MRTKYFLLSVAILMAPALFAQNMNSVVQNHFNTTPTKSTLQTATNTVLEWEITDVVPSLNPQIQHVYVQQKHQGIPIDNARYKLTVNKGQVSWTIDNFVPGLDSINKSSIQNLNAQQAVMKLVQGKNLRRPVLTPSPGTANSTIFQNTGISREPIEAEKVYFYVDGALKLAWKVNLYEEDGSHWWSALIDANTGATLKIEDWVIQCNFGEAHTHERGAPNPHTYSDEPIMMASPMAATALVGGGTYNVYPLPLESPNHGGRSIVSDPADANASPFGWHDVNGAAGAEFTITRGNNVWAQDDINGNNGTGFSPDGGAALDFNFPVNFNAAPSQSLSAATTNLFFWNNVMHDVWYQYGFDEASGNFQENNYGRGGASSDGVFADAQDGSGTNNANFATPPDGQNPRMQMFLWSTTNPQTDGDYDNVIIAHEYGHGISTRLVGGPSTNALGGSEQMGEGWSDWFGLVMTIQPGDTRDLVRGVGTFALGQPTDGLGIRPTHYSPDFAVNNTVYGDINNLAVPHGVGYGFATILWDMTWDLIDLEGFDADVYNGTGGNNIAMALVIEGLKNTANNPGYVSGRDGILQADQDLYGGQYNCLIWDAFARRGVGVDAVENSNGGTNTNRDQIVSFTSGCNSGPPAGGCNTTVNAFPYNEGFENTLGDWSQGSGDDFDWTLNSGGTPSNNTGPSSAIQGTHYVYMEVSSPNNPSRTAILNSPCFDLAGVSGAQANFQFQMTGNAVGTIRLEVREDGANSWTEVWSRSGDQGAAWQAATVDLSSFSGTVQLRFNGTSGSSWQGDIAIDDFQLGEAQDGQAPSAPTNLEVTNVTTTTADLSWDAATDNVAVTGYDVLRDGTTVATVNATNYQDTGLTEDTDYAYSVVARDAVGNLSAESNTVAITTESNTPPSGCAGTVTAPYGESFEANIGLWTQASGDDLNWTRDSGGTPSNGTGPSSGSDGAFYMYVEASGNGTGFPNMRAILNSPCFDLGSASSATFSFDYHMFGSTDAGRIDLEASTDGGNSWTSIWNQTGNQGNQWNAVTINMAAYLGGSVQLRFNRITGGTWQADVAIDNTRLEAGGGGGNTSCATIDLNRTYNPFGGNQDQGVSELLNGNTELRIRNNAWKSIDFPYTITANTVLMFDFRSTVQGEIHGIGFESDNNLSDDLTFKVHGTQNWGIADFDNYPNNGQWVTYTIPVGNFYTGTANQLLFVADHDGGASNGDSWYRNVIAFEDANGNGVCDSSESLVVAGFTARIPTAPLQGDFSTEGLELFSIYPNPVTSDQLNIAMTEAKADRIEIYNSLGQLLYKGRYTNTVDVTKFSPGVYLIKVMMGDGEAKVKRFVVR